jgi:thymidylate synthase
MYSKLMNDAYEAGLKLGREEGRFGLAKKIMDETTTIRGLFNDSFQINLEKTQQDVAIAMSGIDKFIRHNGMNYIEAHTIGDAWRDVMTLCVKNGHDFVVKGGSYEGQIRKQLPFVAIRILTPGQRPLSPILPQGTPPPTTDENIEEYFIKYLMSDELRENEQYTYGSFIVPQINRAIEMLLLSNGNTNQACISIGDRDSINLPDPPCLRTITFKVVKGRLNMSVFFRSWDLFTGLPENLGGLQLVKEYVLFHLDALNIQDGELIAYSDGLHLYDQYFGLVDALNVEKVQVDEKVLTDKATFADETKRAQ